MPRVKPVQFENAEEMFERLCHIPPDRIRMRPYPGTATVADLLKYHERGGATVRTARRHPRGETDGLPGVGRRE